MQDPDLDQELRTLQLDYLVDVREKINVLKNHSDALASARNFKTSFPVLLYLSHQLKGSGGSLGFPEISDLAEKLNGELNGFLDGDEVRPTPVELSRTASILIARLENVVTEAEMSLRTHALIDGI